MIINYIVLFVFIFGLLNPVSVLGTVENTGSQSVEIQHNISTKNKDTKLLKRKKVLSGDRKLGSFFKIGLAINLIMMTTFAIWAFGQLRQHKKKKK